MGQPGQGRSRSPRALVTVALAVASAAYTAWLFGQAKGRVLWMQRGLWKHLIIQAGLAGFAFLAISGWALDQDWPARVGLAIFLVFQLLTEPDSGAPAGREEEFRRAARLITDGPYAKVHKVLGVWIGILLPLVLLFASGSALAVAAAGALALVGLWFEEDVFVRAGQALPIS